MAASDDSATRPALLEVATALRELHRALVDVSRARYEKQTGKRAGGPSDMLRLLTEDPYFAWLHALSELIVDVDALLVQKALPGGTAAAVRMEIEHLTQAESKSAFWQKYAPYIQEEPKVAMAHGKLRQSLKAVPQTSAVGAQVLHERSRWVPPRKKRG